MSSNNRNIEKKPRKARSMALKNYLYAKHANDQFTLKLMKDSNILRPELQPINPIIANDEKDKTKDHCVDIESCNNCANCPNNKHKTQPKISIEIDKDLDTQLESINNTLREIDFTNKI